MAKERSNILPTELTLHALEAQPFLKWAGGKRALLPGLLKHVPKRFRMYGEPFFGGGALFYKLQPKFSIIGDINLELINTLRAVRDIPAQVVRALRKHRYDKDYFYKVREQDPEDLSQAEVAARMIFLNRVGFNGLYRVNSSGKFNVPFGKYTNPKILDEANLYACSEVLQSAVIERFSFDTFPWQIFVKGDFVYFDPPYVPLSKTASFTSYTQGKFGVTEQRELARIFAELAARGVQVMLSNSDTPLVRELYSSFRIEEIKAPRMINSKGDKRGAITELIVLSY